jgi:F-type H+/Na+-transporting ATPase subunit alpha
VHAEISDVLKAIREGDWSDEIQKKLDQAIAQFAEDFGYDLDEEGLPMEDEDHIREGRGARARDEGEDEGETADASEDETREQEREGAPA